MRYEQIETLEKYLGDVEVELLKEEHHSPIIYPNESISDWNDIGILTANLNILKALAGTANVYAIFTAQRDSESFSLRYIGKTTRKLARERIKNHLIKKHEKTGAKLKEIVSHIQSGGKVKISWVKIEPESLRNYIEEELILRHSEADWNRENRQGCLRSKSADGKLA